MIRELYAANDPDGAWTTGSADNRFPAGPTSRLSYYGKSCEAWCKDTNALFFQDPNGGIQYLSYGRISGLDDWTPISLNTDDALVSVSTGYGIVPIRSDKAEQQGLAVFFNAGTVREVRGTDYLLLLGM